MKIRLFEESDRSAWDEYVLAHPHSTHCHLIGWKDVIKDAYGHSSYYLLAEDNDKIIGVLPLIRIKTLLFGSSLVSMPYLNYGGVLADSDIIAAELLNYAVVFMAEMGVPSSEFRQLQPLPDKSLSDEPRVSLRTHKVRMLLELPQSSDGLFQRLKSKLRSQVNRPVKEGMEGVIGGSELIDDFYGVFSVNMRDLGSPVHSKPFFRQIIGHFGESVRIVTVRYRSQSVASALIFCFRDTVEVPWASSLKQYNSLSPNMLLYWSLLKFACDQGYRYFDFGRSTPGEGTARFKEQWGAKPHPLYWYSVAGGKEGTVQVTLGSKSGLAVVEAVWRRVPLFLANLIGPRLRAGIPL